MQKINTSMCQKYKANYFPVIRAKNKWKKSNKTNLFMFTQSC